ncbi:MAG: hypothetical protein DRR08_15840 [Candidatus Parabeggiatoa sp. nov. 2]|nr:MAG: hypothetical protein B6247_14410 [Beggiatoa sp. 4572_84]RKZ58673.1 MAG: hypothetical protein DRR08_15840 [Gammaproteobacteria bacterium]HEC85744.1 hypothetical protein [Thioploca sp.]
MKLDIWKSSEKKTNGATLTSLADLLQGRECGTAVRWGHLEMIPLFGSPCAAGAFAPPESSLRLTQVTNYGEMILKNKGKLPTIVPLNLGYFQNAAQNHAMCVSALLGAGESKQFKDACCIQEAQGGYIHEADERFIILPQPLRDKAFALRGKENYSKLWDDISTLNNRLRLKQRGHLDELKRAYQPQLLQTVYHLEPYPEQTGALFLNNNTIMGIELAPDAAFWNELHTPLVMYCYAPLRIINDIEGTQAWTGESLAVDKLTDLDDLESRWTELVARRQKRVNELTDKLQTLLISSAQVEQRQNKNQLATIKSEEFVGQMVLQDNKPAYVSLSRKTSH